MQPGKVEKCVFKPWFRAGGRTARNRNAGVLLTPHDVPPTGCSSPDQVASDWCLWPRHQLLAVLCVPAVATGHCQASRTSASNTAATGARSAAPGVSSNAGMQLSVLGSKSDGATAAVRSPKMAALLVRVVAGLSSWQSVHRAQVAAHAAALLRLYSAAQTTTPTSSTASGTASSRRRKASPCPAMRLKAVAAAGEAALGDSVLQGIIALLRMPDYEEASAAVAAVEGAAGLLAAMPELAAVLLPCPGGQQEQKQAAQRALQLLWQLHRGAVAASQVGCSIFCG